MTPAYFAEQVEPAPTAPRFSSLPPRSKPLARGKPPRRRNSKRKASEFARCFGSRARVEWFKAQTCIACIIFGQLPDCGPVENAHVTDPFEDKGMARRAHYSGIVPLGRRHHRMFDRWLGIFSIPNNREWIERHASRYAAKWEQVSGGEA